jgi:hypothetical protein
MRNDTNGTTMTGLVRRLATRWSIAVLIGAGGLAAAPAAHAAFGIEAGSFAQTLSTQQAGAHADLTTQFSIEADGAGAPLGNLKDLHLALPPGVVANANAAPTCTMARVISYIDPCPHSTAIGEARAMIVLYGAPYEFRSLVYNIRPYADEPAAFAMNPFVAVRLDASVRSDGDYGITASSTDLAEASPIQSVTVTFWGVPADHNGPGDDFDEWGRGYGGPGEGVRRPFMANPTTCAPDGLTSSLAVSEWADPDVFDTATASLGAITGCDKLAFDPTVSVRPQSRKAGEPTGYDIDIDLPQNDDPDGLATSTLDDAKVVLPAGVALSPAVAHGLDACTDAQFGKHDLAPATCPDAAKIGTVSIDSPLLPGVIDGGAYVGEPLPGNHYRVFFALDGYGVKLKLEGKVAPDPSTGQLTATFDDNPPLAFTNFHVHFKDGPTAPLSNPQTCGSYATQWELAPHSGGDPATGSAPMTIDQGCATGGFAPTLDAGSTNPVAGASAPFTLTFARTLGQEDLRSLDVVLPPGLIGNVGSVPLCGDADAAAGTCPAASRVGSVTALSGNGSSPLSIPQAGKAPTSVSLGGPYKGAPFSLSIVVPAQAGPYDLGTVVVRAALFIDRTDAHVTVKADPMPAILDGIPLRLQAVTVTLDRPGFMLNPTSCAPTAIRGSITSQLGTVADVASRFQVGDCAALPFRPVMTARSKGTLAFKQGAALDVHIAMPAGDANIRSVAVRLPRQLPSRLIPTINDACVLAQFQADYTKCPENSYVGTVRAVTPILPEPLTGPAYVVAPPNDVPRLELKLFGSGIAEGVEVDLSGTIIIDSGYGRTKATFATVPDVPISSFDLHLPTGPHSILDAPGDDLCQGPITMDVNIVAQSGRRWDGSPRIAVDDCPKIASPKVVGVKAGRSGVTVRLKPTHAGEITVSGSGLVPVTKTVTRLHATYSFALRLSSAGKRAIARHGRLRTVPRIAYDPTNGPRVLRSSARRVEVRSSGTRR